MPYNTEEKKREYREKNREKNREYQRRYYQENKKSINKKIKERYHNKNYKEKQYYKKTRSYKRRCALRFVLDSYKMVSGCIKCGYSGCPESLHMHHIGEKSFSINKRTRSGVGEQVYSKIRDEMKKCIVLCANCHGEEHSKFLGGIDA